MHAHLGSQYHQRVPGVISCIAEVRQADSLHSSEMLPDCQQVCKHLRRVKFIGKSVPDRNLRVLRKLFDDILSEPAVLNSVEHPGEDSGRVRNGFLLADLGAGRIQVGCPHAKIMRCDLECAAGSRTRLFENQCNVSAAKVIHCLALLLLLLEVSGKIRQSCDLLSGIIQKL